MHFEKVVLSVLYVLLFACWSLQAQATHGGNTEVRTKGINLVQTLLNAKTISPIKPAESLVDTSFTQQGQQQRLSSFAKRYVTTEPVEEV